MAELQGRSLEDEFNAIVQDLDGDQEGIKRADEYLERTHALYHGDPAPWAFTPKIFDEAQTAILKEAAETMGRIMEKTTSAFMSDPAVRHFFEFSPDMERLCQIPSGYGYHIPIARVDIFFNEETGDYQFCELNTDGSAGMTNTVEITRAIRFTPAFNEFERRHPHIETFDVRDECIYALLDTYGEWAAARQGSNHPTNPSLAIVDYGDSVSADEVEDFATRLQDLGVYAHFSEIRDLKIAQVNGEDRLVDDFGPITCVWRRAVTSELEERRSSGADALVEATRRGLVCTVGGFGTWPCATKTVFALLHDDLARTFLDDEELDFVREHVPETVLLTPESDLARFSDKDSWIIKPQGGYNAQGVCAGLDMDQDAWSERLEAGARDHDVVQRYAPQYRTPILCGRSPEGTLGSDGPVMASNMEGLYLFNGKFCGVYTRCGTHATIGEYQGRLNMGCFVVRD